MRFHHILASLALSGAAAAAPLGCSGGGDTASSGQGGAGGQGCVSTPIDYNACGGTTFFPDGSCAGGSCAVNDPEAKVYAAWKAKVLTLSGLTEQALDQRVTISTIENKPPFVSIRYVVTYDWVRSRQSDDVDLSSASSPPTTAEIESAVAIAVEDPEWKAIGTIEKVAPEDEVRAAFEGCACDMAPDFCHIDFMNVTGRFTVGGIAKVSGAENECLDADVDMVTAERLSCDKVPCEIN